MGVPLLRIVVWAIILQCVSATCWQRCKEIVQYCDRSRGRCGSCEKLCYPGQGNEKPCKKSCPDFQVPGTHYALPGETALNTSRQNAHELRAMNTSLVSLTHQSLGALNKSHSNGEAVSNMRTSLRITGTVLGTVLAAVIIILILLYVYRLRQTIRKKKTDTERCEEDVDDEEKEPINPEPEQGGNQNAERHTGMSSADYESGQVRDLPSDRKATQTAHSSFQCENEIAPSGQPATPSQ